MWNSSEPSALDKAKENVAVAFILGCWTWDLLHEEFFFVRRNIFLRLFAWTSFPVLPLGARAALIAWIFWSVILWCEIIVNEIREIRSRRIGEVCAEIGETFDVYWNVVAVLRPSACYCDVQCHHATYHQVTICDTNVPDDPFWPNHFSTIYIIEMRRHNMIWTTVRVWQVSLLNGGKKIVHQFHQVWPWPDGRPFEYGCTRARYVDCFQSCGVVFIMMRHFANPLHRRYAMLFVYDTRLKKSAVYIMKLSNRLMRQHAISITCIGRLVGTDGSLEGWRIRMLDAARSWFADELFPYRARIINEIYELRQVVSLIKSEEILFGRFFGFPSLQRIRTSRGHFGLQAKRSGETESPIVLFNEPTSDYAVFRTIDDLILMDNQLATYISSVPPELWSPGYGCYVWPVFLNDREAIMSSCGCIVSRTTFRPSSLKYLAAKSLFHSHPQLRTRLNAEQFRQATGIGMEGHFG